jgi:hypothetical protein
MQGAPPEPGRKGTLFAHLGAHKTGSTLLQSVFLAERPRLLREGVAYIPFRDFRRGFTLRTPAWRSAPALPWDEMRAALDSLLPREPFRALLVSDETLLGHLRTDLGNAPDRLYEHCGEAVSFLKKTIGEERMTVFLFIRRLDDFVESAFLQRIRVGADVDFAEYVGGFDLDRLSWVPTVQEIAGALTGPEDRVVVYDHAWLRAAPRAVLADLFGRMGATPPPPEALSPGINLSYTEGQFRLVRRLNRIWPARLLRPGRNAVLHLIERSRGGGGRARFFDAATRWRLAERHKADLAGIAALGGKITLAQAIAEPAA